MEKPILLVVSDFHIKPGARVWRTKPQPFGDIEFALKQVVELSNTLKPEAILIAGDVFDSSVLSPDCLSIFSILFDIDKNIPKYYIQGQHEFSKLPWIAMISLERKDFIYLHNTKVTLPGGYTLYGHDFVNRKEGFLFKDSDILLAHLTWKDLLPINANLEFELKDFVDHHSLVVSGDYHKSLSFSLGTMQFVSPGALGPSALHEVGSSNVVYIDGKLNCAFHPLKARKKFEIDLPNKSLFDKFISEHSEEDFISDLPGDLARSILIFSCEKEFIGYLKDKFKNCYLFFYNKKDEQVQYSKSVPERIQGTFENILINKLSSDFQPLGKKLLNLLKHTPQNIEIEQFIKTLHEEYGKKVPVKKK